MRILCAIDDSEYSKPANSLAGQMVRAFQANLTVLVIVLGASGEGYNHPNGTWVCLK